MKPDRLTRINARVREELSATLYRVGPAQGVEQARISFVEVKVAPDLHNAIVFVSILGDEETRRRSMSFLRSRRADFQRFIAEKVALKYTPKLDFRVTDAIAGGDRVLAILDEIGASESPSPDDLQTPTQSVK
ncbi:MAG: 30S ribosome-binding factor RbfA [Kiritimatiellae bacterium]|nr:30S ribosome-binding factor RbfA [Kiritimatiellia bacterium]